MSETQQDSEARKARGYGALAVLIAVILAGVVAAWRIDGSVFSMQEFEAWVASLGVWGPVAIVLLMVVHCFVPFPAEILALCAGALFGTVYGTVLIWCGAMLGALLSFGLSRLLGRAAVDRLLPERQRKKLDRFSAEQGTMALLISRFIPVIAFNLINYAAGLTRVSLWTFVWTTAVGILPLTILMVFMGAQMTNLSWPVLLAVSGGAVCAVLLGKWLYRRSRAGAR